MRYFFYLFIFTNLLYGFDFNTQANYDRLALIKYMETKFKDPLNNIYQFFPYSNQSQLKNFTKNITKDQFIHGIYAFDKESQKEKNNQLVSFPFAPNIQNGQYLYKRYIQQCIPYPTVFGDYPKFNKKTNQIITLSNAIMQCAKKQHLDIGDNGWNYYSGKTADVEAYISSISAKAKNKIDIKIPTKEAFNAYQNGKKEYYSKRGLLNISCASCHIQGAGKKFNNQFLSPLLGQINHFPVYKTSKQDIFTLEYSISQCSYKQGETPHKPDGKWMANIIYFMSYSSNTTPILQDTRR